MYLSKKIFKISILFLLFFSFAYSKENIAVLASNFQSVLGGNDWDPANCLTRMKTTDGNIYEFTMNLPQGNYEYKVALNGSWEENYGANGERDGKNILFSAENDVNVTFTFNYLSKEITQKINRIIPDAANLLTNISDFIDLSDSETMFLFQTHKNAKVSFYLSEAGKPFKTVADNLEFSGKELTVKDLVPGKQYQYKIVSNYNNQIIESPVKTFTKASLKTVKASPNKWAKDSVFYEVLVRSFYDKSGDGVGDFQGLKEKIPYFKEMGITALWLTPINPSTTYHGYDVTNYKDINKDFGTLEDFKAFMNEAKKNNIKVIMEMVFNHSSIEHPWFKEALKDKNSPYRDYYVWETPLTLNNDLPWWHSIGNDKYLANYSENMPDLNIRNPKVREELKSVVKFWLDLGVDGFRFPNYNYIDNDATVNRLWWDELRNYAKSIRSDAFLAGQNADFDISLSKNVLEEMDSVNDYAVYSFIYTTILAGNFELGKALEFIDCNYREANPDYIGWSTLGDHDSPRLASILKDDINKQKFALSILLTLPSTPFIYYGEELGQKGEGNMSSREPMDWYKGAKGSGMTFADKMSYTLPNDGVSVEEQNSDKNSLLNFTKKLIRIRKENPVIVTGKYKQVNSLDKVNIFEISDKNEKLTVVYNSGDSKLSLPFNSKNIEIAPFSTAIIKNGKNLLAE